MFQKLFDVCDAPYDPALADANRHGHLAADNQYLECPFGDMKSGRNLRGREGQGQTVGRHMGPLKDPARAMLQKP